MGWDGSGVVKGTVLGSRVVQASLRIGLCSTGMRDLPCPEYIVHHRPCDHAADLCRPGLRPRLSCTRLQGVSQSQASS